MIKHLLGLVLFFIITNSSFSQEKIPFFDGFDDNKAGWLVQNDATAKINVKDGSYNFDYKKTTEGWETHKSFDLDETKDFKIETLIVKKSGENSYGYGIMWGKSAAGDFYSFNITGTGYYRVSKSKNGVFSDLVAWKTSSDIKKDNGPYNILKIEKVANTINFFINDVKVESLPFESFFGNQIGFVVYHKQAIEINYLSVYYLTKNEPIVDQDRQEKIPFFDGFDDEKYTWPVKNNASVAINVKDGSYNLEYKNTTESLEVNKAFDLDQSKDFKIETLIVKKSGEISYGYGLKWGVNKAGDFFSFNITGSGYYRIAKSKNGTYSDIVAWKTSSDIKKENGPYNILKIEKVANTINFFINDVKVESLPFESFYGNRIGFVVYNKQTVEVNYLSIYYLSKDNPPVVVNNNNNNNDYNNELVFQDDFNSNTNNWSELSNENVSLSFKSGSYYFYHKREDYGWTSSKSVKIDQSKDFEIEADITKVDGIQNNGYGIIWGRKDSDNEFEFFISGDGSYYIEYIEDGKTHILQNWTKSSAIKTGNGANNKLIVRKEGNQYKFYINGTYLMQIDAKPFYGDYLGFVVYYKQNIAFNNLKVSYLNKKIDNSNDLFFDDFSNNTNDWATGKTNDYELNFSGGKYYFEHKNTSGGWSSTIEKYIDENKDYEIEAKFLKISGIENNGYGILWGRKGSGDSFGFTVTANGLYSIDRSENSNRKDLIDWTTSSFIDKNENTLTIRKEGALIKFFINGNYVNQIANQPFLGNRLGFIIYDNQKIAIDYIKAKYIDSTVKPDIVNVTKSGPFSDDFSSNKNDWAIGNTQDYVLNFDNGIYNFEHKNTTGGWSTTLENTIDQTKNFEITTEIKKISGVENYGFGLAWGRSDSNNQFNFLISSDGNFKIKKMEQGDSKLIQDWTESSFINKGNGSKNILSVRKNDKTLNFYINNNFITSKEFEPFYGDRLGFVVFANQKIAIDNLTVKYLDVNIDNTAPVIVITEPAVERGFKIVEAKKLTVKGKATDADGIFEVTINGVDASLKADGTFEAQVPLRVGDNDLNVKATDLKYNSAITKFKIKREVTPVVIVDPKPNVINNDDVVKTNGGTYYALLIGVSDYDDSKIVSLDGMPTKDIQNLSDVLIGYYQFDKEHVETLFNPTRSKIIRAFDRLSKIVTSKDNLLIFYAGHGTFNSEDNLGYWLPADAEADYTDNWINNAIVVDNIKRIKSKHTFLISDACFSGSIFKTRAIDINKASLSIQKKYELPSRKAMTSGTLKTVPNVSVFMKYLLDRLENNKEAFLAASQLFSQLEDPVGNNSPTTPQFGIIQNVGDEGGDFIFIRKN